jgi:uncharacterized SAM-binding protein YcdF (DUF218 family)
MRPLLSRLLRGATLTLVGVALAITPLGPWLVRDRPVDSPDAILVLGSHEFERLPQAARLAARWPRAQVLLTLPVAVTALNCQDCSNRARTLERAGVPVERIEVLAPRVRNTYDELTAAAGWLRSRGTGRLLVVTSPYHTRRARGLAEAILAGHAVGISACPVPGGLARPWWSRRYDRRYVIYELAALVHNSWRHGIPPRLWLVAWAQPRV